MVKSKIITELIYDGESMDIEKIISIIEFVAKDAIARNESIWYDGIVNPEIRKIKMNVFTVSGKMWVADGITQWKEDAIIKISDKRITRQGIQLKIQIGSFNGEINLLKYLDNAAQQGDAPEPVSDLNH